MSYANAIRLAWTNDGAIRNCAFSNLAITNSAAGIGIDLPPPDEETGDYGREATLIENLVFSSIVMDRVYSSPIRFAISDAPSCNVPNLASGCRRVQLLHPSSLRHLSVIVSRVSPLGSELPALGPPQSQAPASQDGLRPSRPSPVKCRIFFQHRPVSLYSFLEVWR